eukprot:jgi/Psemu1/301709/fgenesh1_kg.42_\
MDANGTIVFSLCVQTASFCKDLTIEAETIVAREKTVQTVSVCGKTIFTTLLQRRESPVS